MNKGIIVLVALVFAVVSINAACTGDCCFTSNVKAHCVGVGKTCDNSDPTNYYACKNSFPSGSGSSCVCTAYSGLQGSCDASNNALGQCRDTSNDYSLACSSSKCLYAGGAVGPGETNCPSDQSNYPNGACILTTNKCSDASPCGNVSSSTGTCNDATNFCPSGSYCAAGANATSPRNCVARQQSGGKCGTTLVGYVSYECDWNLYCSGGSCVAPFSAASGSSCNTVVDCQNSLACLDGKCTKPISQDCSVSGNDCPTGYICECKSLTSGDKGKCFANTIDKDTTTKISALLGCMKNAGCTADFPWAFVEGGALSFFQHTTSFLVAQNTPDACYNKKCRSQVQDLYDLAGLNADCGNSGGSAGNTITVAVFFVFALFAFVLMF